MQSMSKFKPQYRRLLFIDRRIRESAGLETLPNCNTLAEEWETSPKTIQRDIEFLKWEMDAPIEYDRVRHGYTYTEADFMLPAVRIAESDLFAICLAEKVLRQYENTPVYSRLAKVFEKIEQYLPDQVSIHPAVLDDRFSFFPEASPRINPAIWEEAVRALTLGHTLDIRYQRPAGAEPYDTRVDPYHLVGYRGEFYVIGRCHYKNALRMFGISRIKSAVVSRNAFQIPSDFDFQTQWQNHFGIMAGGDEVTVRVRFRGDQAPYVRERDWHPSQEFVTDAEGNLVMIFKTRHLFEVTRWVLTWGSAATVLEPPELAEAVRREAEQTALNYPAPQ
jgi:proteasome accessory factor B